MSALNKKSFKLPRVEKEKFILLLRLGLEYNRENGTYSINNYNNIERLMDTISNILNTDEISFLQNCSLCNKDFSCLDCKYYEQCATRNQPFHCVCPKCLKEGKTNENHQEPAIDNYAEQPEQRKTMQRKK